jgi:quercetin dioxygenase-like cupin family protein
VADLSIGKPYTEYLGSGYKLRVFLFDTPEEELVWHRDRSDREVEVVSGVGWKLQLDDQLPEELHPGGIYYIPAMTYHRIIKGSTSLTIKIREDV